MSRLRAAYALLIALLVACKADLGPKVGEYNSLIIDIEAEAEAVELVEFQKFQGVRSATTQLPEIEESLKRKVNRADDLRRQIEQDSAFSSQYYFAEYVSKRELYGKRAFRRITPVK